MNTTPEIRHTRYRVCENHFTKEDYIQFSNRLTGNAVPIFNKNNGKYSVIHHAGGSIFHNSTCIERL